MIDKPRSTDQTVVVPIPYLPMAIITAVVFVGVSLLNPPIWLGALLAGGLMAAAASIMRAALRWRSRAGN